MNLASSPTTDEDVARASGKVILLGEHAAVYGVPALAAGIHRGAFAVAHRSERSTLQVGTRRAAVGDGSDLGLALEALIEELGAAPVEVAVTLELPPGSGLGASAAIGVAAARAILDVCDGEEPNSSLESTERTRRVLAGAGAWERVFHGNPSGIDAAAATLGGCIYYTREDGAAPIRLRRALRLGIALAGPPASTREMVEGVAELRRRRPEVVDKALEGIRSLVQNARVALDTGDLRHLGQLLNLNQMLLSGLFVSTEGIERACQIARAHGALGAKLTGSGGGGAVIALLGDEGDDALSAWKEAGFDAFVTTVGS